MHSDLIERQSTGGIMAEELLFTKNKPNKLAERSRSKVLKLVDWLSTHPLDQVLCFCTGRRTVRWKLEIDSGDAFISG